MSDLTHITGLLLTEVLAYHPPQLTHDGELWSLSDDGAGGRTLWRLLDDYTWNEVAHISLTVDVKPLPGSVVVGGVVYTGEEGVTE